MEKFSVKYTFSLIQKRTFWQLWTFSPTLLTEVQHLKHDRHSRAGTLVPLARDTASWLQGNGAVHASLSSAAEAGGRSTHSRWSQMTQSLSGRFQWISSQSCFEHPLNAIFLSSSLYITKIQHFSVPENRSRTWMVWPKHQKTGGFWKHNLRFIYRRPGYVARSFQHPAQ